MAWHQHTIRLRPRPRGFHLVTREILGALPSLRTVRVGLLHLFLQHTSASLSLGENADPAVRDDLERWTRAAVPDAAPYFAHVTEGADDMPAHVKAALFGDGLTLPVADGRLALGTWQGIYLGEHREDAGARTVVATLWGEGRPGS
jgi:secondary thiamine-phosphate synthase enzyme